MSKNFTIRGARREFRERFTAAIDDFGMVALLCDCLRSEEATGEGTKVHSAFSTLPLVLIQTIFSYVLNVKTNRDLVSLCWSPLRPPATEDRFHVAVRKRPLWASERTEFEAFDTLTVHPRVGRCVLHDSRIDRGHQTFTYHREFALDQHFDESSSTAEVFECCVRPLLEQALDAGQATFCAFGQTGTGKTFTVHGVEQALVRNLFPLGSTNHGREEGASLVVEVTIFEMQGKACRDLLSDGAPVKLMQAQDGSVQVHGAAAVVCGSGAALEAAFARAHALRSTACTARNEASSRSHAIARLTLRRPCSAAAAAAAVQEGGAGEGRQDCAGGQGGGQAAAAAAAKGGLCGTLTLVDLAGSERHEDVGLEVRSKRQNVESAQINSSLMTLKECFRAVCGVDVEQEAVLEVRALSNGALLSTRKLTAADVAHGVRLPPTSGDGGRETGEGGTCVEDGGGGGGGRDEQGGAPTRTTGIVERVVMRTKAGGKVRALRMPFRESLLTLVLKDCFTNPKHRTVVLACVSPTPQDVEHSRRTLELVASMRGGDLDLLQRCAKVSAGVTRRERHELEPVSKWTPPRVAAWAAALNAALAARGDRHRQDSAEKAEGRTTTTGAPPRSEGAATRTPHGPPKPWQRRKRGAETAPPPEPTPPEPTQPEAVIPRAHEKRCRPFLKLPQGLDGKELVRLSVLRLRKYCQGDKSLADEVFQAVRQEVARVREVADEKRRRKLDLLYGKALVKGAPIVLPSQQHHPALETPPADEEAQSLS